MQVQLKWEQKRYEVYYFFQSKLISVAFFNSNVGCTLDIWFLWNSAFLQFSTQMIPNFKVQETSRYSPWCPPDIRIDKHNISDFTAKKSTVNIINEVLSPIRIQSFIFRIHRLSTIFHENRENDVFFWNLFAFLFFSLHLFFSLSIREGSHRRFSP